MSDITQLWSANANAPADMVMNLDFDKAVGIYMPIAAAFTILAATIFFIYKKCTKGRVDNQQKQFRVENMAKQPMI